jgi:hypothetical protein
VRTRPTATQKARIQGTPRWAEQAFKAEVELSAAIYHLSNYHQHVDAARTDTGSLYPLPRYRLVKVEEEGGKEPQSAWLTDVVKATHS